MNSPLNSPLLSSTWTGSTDLLHFAKEATPAIVQGWRMLQIHRLQILLVTAIVTLLGTVIVLQMTPIYRPAATLLVESSKNKVVSIDEVYGGMSSNREYFQTQVDFLKSREVAMRVIRQLKLADNAAFDPRQNVGMISGLIKKVTGGEAPTATEIDNAVLAKFQADLTITQMRSSQLISVEFESPDAELATQIANTVVDQYIRADLDARFDMTQKANKWLSERLAVLRGSLDQSEKALQQYRDNAGIVEGKNTTQGSAGRQLDEISQRLVQAKIARSQAEQIYNQVRGNASTRYQVPSVFNNPSVARARDLESAAEAKLSDAGQKVGPAHPQYMAAQNELAQARANTQRQADAVISSIAKDYEVAAATERALDDSLDKARGSLQQFNRKEIQLDSLDREAASNRQIYQTFLSRVKETGATGDFLTPIARVVDPAAVPPRPAKPQKAQLIMLSLVVGLLLGILVAWLRERMSHVVRASDEVEDLLRVPLLSAVPLLPPDQIERSAFVQVEHPTSLFAESVRTVLTGVQLATLNIRQPIIAFTSTLPGEGKSTLAINFALEQARTKRVLLIDLDLRRPTVGSRLGLPGDSRGVADLIVGSCDVNDCIFKIETPKLSVLPAGRVRPNAHELLSSPEFATILKKLRGMFDLVIIDTPPAQVVSDVLLVCGQCTGVVYVVKSGETPVPLIRRNLSRLKAAGAEVFGVALNSHDFQRAEKYYGEYSAYTKYGYENTP